jgi:hypothetical protein
MITDISAAVRYLTRSCGMNLPSRSRVSSVSGESSEGVVSRCAGGVRGDAKVGVSPHFNWSMYIRRGRRSPMRRGMVASFGECLSCLIKKYISAEVMGCVLLWGMSGGSSGCSEVWYRRRRGISM